MKTILFLAVFSITLLGLSQNKFHFGIQINGNFTTGITSSTEYPASYYKGLETFSFSYSGGGTVAYNLTNKFTLQSGLLCRKSGDKSGTFPVEPFRPYPIRYFYNKFGIETPLNLKYILNKKLKLVFGASIAYNFFSKYAYYDSKSTFDVVSSSNEINPLDLYANLGIEYNLTDKFSITAYSQFDVLKTQYEFLVFLNPERNYLSLGLNVGYRFN